MLLKLVLISNHYYLV